MMWTGMPRGLMVANIDCAHIHISLKSQQPSVCRSSSTSTHLRSPQLRSEGGSDRPTYKHPPPPDREKGCVHSVSTGYTVVD